MKRNLYCILMVLFILAACVPIPQGLDQAATATQELVEGSSSRMDLPAPVLLEDGQEVNISLSDYPTNPDNFIIDTRTNEEKMALIRSWAPDDVKKEIALYNAEFERMGVDPNKIEYKASIVDGKSWALYPENRITGTLYVVSINGIIRPSIDLFGYLDRSVDDDFFDLTTVNIDNAQVVGDKSGWHVFANIENGKVTKWYDAVHDQINTIEIEPTPTPENILRIVEVDEAREMIRRNEFSTELPRVTLEDITSGRLLEVERKWIKEHPFSSEVVPVDLVIEKQTNYVQTFPGNIAKKTTFYEIGFETDPKLDYQKNPNLRPFKIIGLSNFWDEKIYSESGFFEDVTHEWEPKKGISQFYKTIDEKGSFFLIISWVFQNPNGEVFIGHSIAPAFASRYYFNRTFNKTSKVNGEWISWEYDTKIRMMYDFKSEPFYENMLSFNALTNYIWKNYPGTGPKPLIDKAVSSDSFPKELETTLFTFNFYQNYPW
ncbi:MAG: hypothetical protein Q8N39_01420 [Pelolinea sp.]|nr:hypothetical protein [Pelolinea sp.]